MERHFEMCGQLIRIVEDHGDLEETGNTGAMIWDAGKTLLQRPCTDLTAPLDWPSS